MVAGPCVDEKPRCIWIWIWYAHDDNEPYSDAHGGPRD